MFTSIPAVEILWKSAVLGDSPETLQKLRFHKISSAGKITVFYAVQAISTAVRRALLACIRKLSLMIQYSNMHLGPIKLL